MTLHRTIAPGLVVAGLLFSTAAFALKSEAPPKISDPWMRQPVAGRGMSAAYMSIENADDAPDALVSATCDCAKRVELHVMEVDHNVMKMKRVERLELPAKGFLKLEPGGAHIMLFDLVGDLAPGHEATFKLRFERAGEVEVKATVRPPGEERHAH